MGRALCHPFDRTLVDFSLPAFETRATRRLRRIIVRIINVFSTFLSCEHVYVRTLGLLTTRPRPRVVPAPPPVAPLPFCNKARRSSAHASSGDALPGEIGVKGTPSRAAYRLRSSSYFSSTPACSCVRAFHVHHLVEERGIQKRSSGRKSAFSAAGARRAPISVAASAPPPRAAAWRAAHPPPASSSLRCAMSASRVSASARAASAASACALREDRRRRRRTRVARDLAGSLRSPPPSPPPPRLSDGLASSGAAHVSVPP